MIWLGEDKLKDDKAREEGRVWWLTNIVMGFEGLERYPTSGVLHHTLIDLCNREQANQVLCMAIISFNTIMGDF